jgi:hypothetical protein
MNEDVLNMSVRKFLKQVGVTSQREIETAVRQAIASGRLEGKRSLKARMTLSLEGLEFARMVEDTIELG